MKDEARANQSAARSLFSPRSSLPLFARADTARDHRREGPNARRALHGRFPKKAAEMAREADRVAEPEIHLYGNGVFLSVYDMAAAFIGIVTRKPGRSS